MSKKCLLDGTPVPESLESAFRECDHWTYSTSATAAALRALAGVIGDCDHPINPDNLPGLAMAIELIGDHLEHQASDRREWNENIAKAAHARQADASTSPSCREASE